MKYRTKLILNTHIPIISIIGILIYIGMKHDSPIYLLSALLLSALGMIILMYQYGKYYVEDAKDGLK